MKILLILLDGVGDRPSKVLNGLTPLQAARIPFLNGLAREGANGLMDPVSPGIPVGSDTGHLAILGYDPYKYYPGRGPFEALGAGIRLKPGDVAFRCNFATVSGDTKVVDRRAGRISSQEAAQLVEALSEVKEVDGVEVILKHTVEHRSVLVLRGEVSDKITDVDPHKDNLDFVWPKPTDETREAKWTAEALTKLLRRYREILEAHPVNIKRREAGLPTANMLLPRGAGMMPSLPPLSVRFGVKGAVIAGAALYKGVCSSAGMDVVEAPGATGTLNTDLNSKFKTAFETLRNYDFVFLHIKGTDTAAHDKDPLTKASFLEKIDAWFTKNFNPPGAEFIICVTGDHTTSSLSGEHRGDPVPVLIWGYGVRIDPVDRFNEVDAARGALGRIKGTDLMNILMDLANKTEKFGE
ncbi:MAG: 2,3-bisphosphoglycerate-independent phosphoglycerate mutase [Nitrososphaerota archaeon]|nr:2,3-bisphosphoglycerate-independent phosphoglycerate mutase [Candidatus Calditenuaceae archaeon]MDW8072642.1 2,3-bisphosphoglycerate-independent phosphoglycerate mutase [Nitrososphaerota archaeon]